MNFISRQSNSPYFRNFVDVNFKFDRYTYNKNLKQQLLNKLKAQVPQLKYPDLSKAEAELKKLKDQYTTTESWLEDPATLQKIIEEREKAYYQKTKAQEESLNTLLVDKVGNKANNPLDSINKLKDSALSFVTKAKGVKDKMTDSLASVKNKLLTRKDSLVNNVKNKIDSIAEPYAKLYERKKQQLDSLEKKWLCIKIKQTA